MQRVALPPGPDQVPFGAEQPFLDFGSGQPAGGAQAQGQQRRRQLLRLRAEDGAGGGRDVGGAGAGEMAAPRPEEEHLLLGELER